MINMKNKTIFVSGLVSLFLLSSASVNAIDRPQLGQEKKAGISANRQERRSDVAKKHADRLEQRFGNYYTRLSTILTKLQARVDAISADKKDTTIAKARLAEAKTKLEEAKTLGATAVGLFRSIDPAKWSEQKTQAVAARDTANQAVKAFKAAHALMVEAIRSLKSINAK